MQRLQLAETRQKKNTSNRDRKKNNFDFDTFPKDSPSSIFKFFTPSETNLKRREIDTQKILRQLIVAATFGISMMTYMRASTEELSEENPSTYNVFSIALLAFFAGICEALELYDHLFPQASKDIESDTTASSTHLIETPSIGKNAAVAAAFTLATPPLALCAWAHKLQGDELARSIGAEEKLWGMVFATPALVKFCSISIPHLLHTLNGTRERFSLSVTHNEMKQLPEKTFPPLSWWIMLSILVYLHLPEGELIASPIKNQLYKNLATLGFSLAESIPHLNQLEQLPQNLIALFKNKENNSLLKSALRVGAGTIGGIGAASEALLAALVGTRSKITAWIAPLVEFTLGFAETQQHLVPSLQKVADVCFFQSTKELDTTQSSKHDQSLRKFIAR